MKKTFLLNSEISYAISKLGHTESLCVADCGLPVPQNVRRIDLAVSAGIPSFADVLRAVLSEMQVESVLLAEEIKSNADFHGLILDMIKTNNPQVKVIYAPHSLFKIKTEDASAVIRTGEQTAFANILLYSGVVF
ncbi:MAG: D-ribose pyranase [Spirochaetaceae bacterium]|jgi:D-ribose pyranase|nr:D-ribose pyranase [Spirochaetaceae bacterium]